jgi:hypothetical protein
MGSFGNDDDDDDDDGDLYLLIVTIITFVVNIFVPKYYHEHFPGVNVFS